DRDDQHGQYDVVATGEQSDGAVEGLLHRVAGQRGSADADCWARRSMYARIAARASGSRPRATRAWARTRLKAPLMQPRSATRSRVASADSGLPERSWARASETRWRASARPSSSSA